MANVNKIISRINAQQEQEYRRGQIYYVEKGNATGSEQQAGRPAIIVSNNSANEHSECVTVVFLTTQPKKELPTHVFISSAQRISTALCECVTGVSKDRLLKYYGKATKDEMKQIDEALKIALSLHTEQQERVSGNETEESTQLKGRLNEAERAYKQALEELKKNRKEAVFYKMLYDDTIEKMKHFALGGIDVCRAA